MEPKIKLETPDGYIWKVYDVGLTVLALENPKNGIVVSTVLTGLPQRLASTKAWAGARHSRSAMAPWEILWEMQEKNIDADTKLTDTAIKIGHASVGDLARVQFDLSNVPVHLLTNLFLEGWGNGGQEKSTRYQVKFGTSKLFAGNSKLGKLALKLYNKNYDRIYKAFKKYYKPDETQENTLISRTLDCVRFFLPWGQCSGATFENSVRDTCRIISELKASPLLVYRDLANQVERLFNPTLEEESQLGITAEAPGLFKHTEAATTTNDNLVILKNYLEKLKTLPKPNKKFKGQVIQEVVLVDKKYSAVEKMIAQYILLIYPGLDFFKLLEWVKKLKPKNKKEISRIIFSGHNHHDVMSFLTRTSDTTVLVRGFLGEDRDLIRQRAWGRFIPIPGVFGLKLDRALMDQILASGFGIPENLNFREFSSVRKAFISDLKTYYKELFKLFKNKKDNYEEIINLLPLAHQVDLIMHGTPGQIPYLYHLRRRPGGHCNYRLLMNSFGDQLASSDPYLSAVSKNQPINLLSREDFFDRS